MSPGGEAEGRVKWLPAAILHGGVWPDKRDQPTTRERHIKVCDDVRPLIFAIKLLARFPYTRTDSGRILGRVVSWWSFYTLVVGTALLYVTVENTLGTLNAIRSSGCSFNDLLFNSFSLMFMAFLLLAPVSVVADTNGMVRYFNKWSDFQEDFHRLVRDSNVKTYVWVVVLIILINVPTVAVFTYLVSAVVFFKHWYSLIPYFTSYLIWDLYLFIWVFLCMKLITYTENLMKHLDKLVEGGCNLEEARTAKDLWLSLSGLLSELGSAFAVTLSTATLIAFTAFVCSAYGLVSSLSARESYLVGLLVVFFSTSCFLIFLCEAAHRTTQQVGSKFSKALIKSSCVSTLDNKTKKEVDLLLQAIQLNPPEVRLAGLIKMNRGTLVSVVSSTVTYLVVLVQFNTTKWPTEVSNTTGMA